MLKDDLLKEMCGQVDAGVLEIVGKALDAVLPHYVVSQFECMVGTQAGVPAEVCEYVACKRTEGCSKGFCETAERALSMLFKRIGLPLAEIKTAHIRMYMADYKAERKVTDRTMDSLRITFNGFFGWCVDEGYIASNPCKQIKRIRFEHKQRIYLSTLELEYMRRAYETVRESAFVETLYSTGCRISEIAGMQIADIDWTNRAVKVFGKGKKERVVFLNDKAFIALRNYLDSRNDANASVFVGERAPHCSLTVNALEKAYKTIWERTDGKVRKHSPHSMRHTTATLALESGMPIESISRMLGHANISTTLIYAETNEEKLHAEHKRYVV